ncbi:hypothetical protein KL941_002075 [Ogataea angusta]|nr:hypothetical protein KL941_002075 [Ogataea angusta]
MEMCVSHEQGPCCYSFADSFKSVAGLSVWENLRRVPIFVNFEDAVGKTDIENTYRFINSREIVRLTSSLFAEIDVSGGLVEPFLLARCFLFGFAILVEKDKHERYNRAPMYAVRLNATQPFFDRLAKDFPNLKQHHLDDSYYGFLVAELHTATGAHGRLLPGLPGVQVQPLVSQSGAAVGEQRRAEQAPGLSAHDALAHRRQRRAAQRVQVHDPQGRVVHQGQQGAVCAAPGRRPRRRPRVDRRHGAGVCGAAQGSRAVGLVAYRRQPADLCVVAEPVHAAQRRAAARVARPAHVLGRQLAQVPVQSAARVPVAGRATAHADGQVAPARSRAAGRRVRPAGRVRRPAAARHRGDPRVARAQDVQRGLHRGDRAALVPGLGRVHDGGRGADGGAVSVRDVRRGGGLETDGEPGFRAVGRSPQRKLDGHFLPVGLGARAQQAPQRQAAAGGVLRDESGRADLRNTRLSAVRGRVAAGADGPDRQGVHPAVCGVRQGLHGVWDEQLRQELSAVHWQQHCGVRARRFRVQLSLVEGVAQLALPQSVQADAAAQGAGAGWRRADRRDGDARVLQPAVCGVCVQQQHGQAVRDARVSGELLDPADGAEQPGAHSGDAPVGDGDSDELAGDSHGTAAGGAAAQLFCRQVPAAARGFRKAAGGAGRVPAELL